MGVAKSGQSAMYQQHICTGDMGGDCGSTYEAKSYGRSMYGKSWEPWDHTGG